MSEIRILSAAQVDKLFTDHWKLEQAEQAYRLFDGQAGGKGVWGQIPMPPNNVTPEEAKKLATWVLTQK